MKVTRSVIASLSKLSLRFGFVALVVSVASVASLASPLPTIAAVSGSSQPATYGSSFPKPLVVKVTNPSTKLGIPGIQVNFTASAGIQLSAPFVTTDASGQASVTVTGTAAGTSSAIAQINGSSASVTFIKLVVNKAVLTVVPDDVESIVGIVPHFTGYSLHGFVNGDTAATANITGTPAFTTVATTKSPATTYGIRTAAGTLTSPNYSFVQGLGHLTLTSVPICGNLGTDTSTLLSGTYAFDMYNQQGGQSGILTIDGTSKVSGQIFFNASNAVSTEQWSLTGNYRIGNGYRGGAAFFETSSVNSTIHRVDTMCFAVDNVKAGVAASGRIIDASGYMSSAAGAFYRVDGSATSVHSFKGTYVLGLQGTKLDTSSGNPLQSAEVGMLQLDGNGNVTGSLCDFNTVETNGSGTAEQYSAQQQLTGSYTFDPSQQGGVITLNQAGVTTHFQFFAPSDQRLLLTTSDTALIQGGSSSIAIHFGEARKQAAGPFSAAAVSGSLNFVSQGVDPSTPNADLIAELSSVSFDGVGSMSHQGKFTVLYGSTATVQDATGGSFPYTVDPLTGRFESRDPHTNACNLCGYLISPNELVALAPGSGLPLFATLKSAANTSSALKLSGLNGKFSVGTLALTSPQAEPFDGVLTFDGRGGVLGASDTHSNVYGQINNLSFSGTYAVTNGAYTITLAGSQTPDFYLYPNTNGGGTIVPISAKQIANTPLLTLNPILMP